MNNINIYLEANPNPNSLKFVTDKILSTVEKYRNNIIKNELRKMLAVNLTTYPIKFSMNSLLISKQNSITGLSRRSEIEKYLPINEWLDNSSLAQQFDVKKVTISNDFLYLK